MLWKHIFNASLKYWNHKDEAVKAAYNCGYKMLTWCGHLYLIDDNLKCIEIGRIEDLGL